jgi:hypothetical protein
LPYQQVVCQPEIANCSGTKTVFKATAEAALKAEMEAFEDVQELLCQNLSAGQLVEVLKLNGIDPVLTHVFYPYFGQSIFHGAQGLSMTTGLGNALLCSGSWFDVVEPMS